MSSKPKYCTCCGYETEDLTHKIDIHSQVHWLCEFCLWLSQVPLDIRTGALTTCFIGNRILSEIRKQHELKAGVTMTKEQYNQLYAEKKELLQRCKSLEAENENMKFTIGSLTKQIVILTEIFLRSSA